jgi:hypothetical protein
MGSIRWEVEYVGTWSRWQRWLHRLGLHGWTCPGCGDTFHEEQGRCLVPVPFFPGGYKAQVAALHHMTRPPPEAALHDLLVAYERRGALGGDPSQAARLTHGQVGFCCPPDQPCAGVKDPSQAARLAEEREERQRVLGGPRP